MSGSITTLLLNRRPDQTNRNGVRCLFKGRHRSLLARLPLLVIFCNKMAVVPESRVLTFSVFKWSSYSSTYLPEWVARTLGGRTQTPDCAVTDGLWSPRHTGVVSLAGPTGLVRLQFKAARPTLALLGAFGLRAHSTHIDSALLENSRIWNVVIPIKTLFKYDFTKGFIH